MSAVPWVDIEDHHTGPVPSCDGHVGVRPRGPPGTDDNLVRRCILDTILGARVLTRFRALVALGATANTCWRRVWVDPGDAVLAGLIEDGVDDVDAPAADGERRDVTVPG
jgi:hypothetical protein